MAKGDLIWTFTLLDAYQNCNYKGFRKYLAPDDLRVPYVESGPQAWGNYVHKAFEKRVGHGEPLPDDLAKHEDIARDLVHAKAMPELKLGVRANGQPCGFYECGDGDGRGKIDTVVMRGTAAAIFDYKTSNKPREYPDELAIQALLLKAKYPHLQAIIGHYVWLAHNRIGKPHNVSDTEKTWRKVRGIVAHIRLAKERDWWPKNENPLCAWCDVSKADCEFRKDPPNG